MVPDVLLQTKSREFILAWSAYLMASDQKQIREVHGRGNDFYYFSLGDSMTFFSGIISHSHRAESIEELQNNKMTVVCQKIGLRARDTVIDTGMQLGNFQCVRKCGTRGESHPRDFELQWCFCSLTAPREPGNIVKPEPHTLSPLSRHFAVVASVFEADLLEDQGVFFLHIGGLRKRWQFEHLTCGLFMNKYMFSGAHASVPLGMYINLVEGAGFEVKSVDTIGVHSETTIWRWYGIWKSNNGEVVDKYREKCYRIWQYLWRRQPFRIEMVAQQRIEFLWQRVGIGERVLGVKNQLGVRKMVPDGPPMRLSLGNDKAFQDEAYYGGIWRPHLKLAWLCMTCVVTVDSNRPEKTIGATMRSSTKTRPSIRPTADRRYSARYLILIYRGTRAHFDPLEIQRLVAREQANCTIVRHSEDDNVSSYFAFVDFAGKRFQTRNLGLFDTQQYHPKWIHVTSSPWRKLDEMIAQGDVLWNGIVRPNRYPSADHKKPAASKISSPRPWEMVGSATSEASFQELLRKEMTIAQSDSPEPLFDDFDIGATSEDGETEMARNVKYWQDGYRAGYKAAMFKLNVLQATPNAISRHSDVSQCAHFFSPNDGTDVDGGGSTSCTQSHISTATGSQIQSELSKLDWNFELDDIWNHQRAE
ncbi:uncharacterized protein N7482_010629 [Penicillium canariense]|uniref:sphingolipid C(9)-methyltransferase n=1 Tax=Penicillium canariense TaxID=189055 RepID=A0A9W9HN90_9EURO|nr:uncharacterized protein N7482_010629 [Penicillium canariense]KAJ5151377.1 hypothetical protein N7482_010629 [Penicillium canariense]